jgi:molecular chaperone GrpE
MSAGKRGSGNDRHDDRPADELEPVPSPVAVDDTGSEEDGGLASASPESGLVPAGDEDLESLRRERDELKDALLRRRADFENYRRRVERDRAVAAAEAREAVFRDLVNTVDNLERALASTGPEDGLRQGVLLTYRDLLAFLEANGVKAIDPAGERFDPALHQALTHEPVPGLEEGTVAEVFRKGYRFQERLLRPALVRVASGDSPETAGDGDVQ